MRAVSALLVAALVVIGSGGVASAQVTPSNSTATDTGPADEPLGGFEALDNVLVFIFLWVGVATAMGLAGGSLSVGLWGGYLVFCYLAITADISNLINVVYASITLMFVGIGFKVWRLEGGGEV